MLIELAQGATEPGLDWVSVRLYNYNRKCERRRNENEAEKEEVNSRVDISAHSAHPSLQLQQLGRVEQQQTSLQGEREIDSHDFFVKIIARSQRIYFKYLKVGGIVGSKLSVLVCDYGASWQSCYRSYQAKSAGDKNIISLVNRNYFKTFIEQTCIYKLCLVLQSNYGFLQSSELMSLSYPVCSLMLLYPHHGPMWLSDWHSVLHLSPLQYTASVSVIHYSTFFGKN